MSDTNYKMIADVDTTYFDFGADLLPGECDLILALAQFHDVRVIVPNSAWQNRDRNLFKSYQRIESAAKVRTAVDDTVIDAGGSDPRYLRFSSMLAEVKDAVAEARRWLDAGVPAKKIGILAADIGLYWPVLEAHLRWEGIAVDRDVKSPVQTLPDFQRWLARLHLAVDNFDQTDLEPEWAGRFRDFEHYYARFYDAADLQRSPQFAQGVQRLVKSVRGQEAMPISFSQFCERAQKLWPNLETLFALEILFQDLQKQNADVLKLSFSDWVRVAESSGSALEQVAQRGSAQGIACLDLSSAEYFDGSHVYIMGLSEDALRRNQSLHVLDRDVVDLSNSTGFDLPFPETRQLEWELPWLLNASKVNVVLSFPESNFDGSPLTPSICWLRGSFKAATTHQLQTPQVSRWDELQRQPYSVIGEKLNWTTTEMEKFEAAFIRERDKKQFPLWTFADWQERLGRFSPSLLQKYTTCPFIVLTERVWGQSDLPDLDLDIDPMTRGKLLHRIFETLLASGSIPELTDGEINVIIRQSMNDIEMQMGEPKLQRSAERRLQKIAREFLEREREWRKLYPQTHTVGREVSVDGWIDLESGQLYREPPEGSRVMVFKGQIDRVDEDENHQLVILDYKSSGTGLNSHNLWLKNNQLQLALYMESVMQGMTNPPLPSGQIVAAQYFVVKDFSRAKGLVITGVADPLVCVSTRSRSRMTPEQFEIFRTQLREHVALIFRRMDQGEWVPAPLDPDACPRCQWRGLCRAPHLI